MTRYVRNFDVMPGSTVASDVLEGEFQRIADWAETVEVDVEAAAQAVGQAESFAGAAGGSAMQAQAAAGRSEAAAALAQNLVNAPPFVPNQVYQAITEPAISHVNLQAYRRRTTGSGPTDPALDPVNWERVGDPGSVINDPFFWMN